MRRMTVGSLNLNGIVVSGTEPITPRTRGFFEQRNVTLTQNGGNVTLFFPPGFSLTKEETDAFLASRGSYQPGR